MWNTFLIWLAEFLVKYFLDSQIKLRRELQESMVRENDFREALKKHELESGHLQDVIQQKTLVLNGYKGDIEHLNSMIKQTQEQRDAKVAEAKSIIDNMSDSQLVRADL